MVTVLLSDLIDGFYFASADGLIECAAYLCLDTGKVYFTSEESDIDEDLPDDLETSDRYLVIPDKRELDLGRELALSFIEEKLPDDYDTVATYFRSRGAYSRFKDLLDARGVIQHWYDFERQAIESALCEWCEDNGIYVVKQAASS